MPDPTSPTLLAKLLPFTLARMPSRRVWTKVWPSALLLAVSALAGCGGFEERATQVVFAPDSADFWALPMPSDLRRDAAGKLDLTRWPGPWRPNSLVEMWLESSKERLADGWGVSSGVFFTLSADVDPASLPADPAASLAAGSSVYLLDVDPDSPERGRRFPLTVEFRAKGDLYAPARVLSAVPVFGFVRRPATTYAVVITEGVRDTAGQPIGRSAALHEALSGDGEARVVEHFAPLVDQLEAEGVDLDTVVGATVFRTFDHNATLRKLAAWAEALPAPTLTASVAVRTRYESYQVVTTRFEVPVIQAGDRPYSNLGEGRLVLGADGQPVVKETQPVDLVITLPTTGAPPAAGFPLTIYAHGSGGNRWQAVERSPKPEIEDAPDPAPGLGPAEWLARRGVATLALDFPLHGGRHNPPDTSGLVFYNLFGNIDATIDNFSVAVMELVLLTRLVESIRIDPSIAPGVLSAGAAADGKIKFDMARLTAMGQSMGTTLAVPWATVDPRVDGFVFSGAGGMLVEIAVTATEPAVLKPVIEGFTGLSQRGEELHLAHPLLHAFQNVWDWVDPVAKAPYISRMPHAGFAPRHVMMTAGFRDGYFHPRSEAAIAVALGATQGGDEIEPILPAALALDGRTRAPLPLAGNLAERTVGVVAYAAPNTQGHYVVFNQEGARYQYTCFVASVGVVAAPAIPAPAALDAPCP